MYLALLISLSLCSFSLGLPVINDTTIRAYQDAVDALLQNETGHWKMVIEPWSLFEGGGVQGLGFSRSVCDVPVNLTFEHNFTRSCLSDAQFIGASLPGNSTKFVLQEQETGGVSKAKEEHEAIPDQFAIQENSMTKDTIDDAFSILGLSQNESSLLEEFLHVYYYTTEDSQNVLNQTLLFKGNNVFLLDYSSSPSQNSASLLLLGQMADESFDCFNFSATATFVSCLCSSASGDLLIMPILHTQPSLKLLNSTFTFENISSSSNDFQLFAWSQTDVMTFHVLGPKDMIKGEIYSNGSAIIVEITEELLDLAPPESLSNQTVLSSALLSGKKTNSSFTVVALGMDSEGVYSLFVYSVSPNTREITMSSPLNLSELAESDHALNASWPWPGSCNFISLKAEQLETNILSVLVTTDAFLNYLFSFSSGTSMDLVGSTWSVDALERLYPFESPEKKARPQPIPNQSFLSSEFVSIAFEIKNKNDVFFAVYHRQKKAPAEVVPSYHFVGHLFEDISDFSVLRIFQENLEQESDLDLWDFVFLYKDLGNQQCFEFIKVWIPITVFFKNGGYYFSNFLKFYQTTPYNATAENPKVKLHLRKNYHVHDLILYYFSFLLVFLFALVALYFTYEFFERRKKAKAKRPSRKNESIVGIKTDRMDHSLQPKH